MLFADARGIERGQDQVLRSGRRKRTQTQAPCGGQTNAPPTSGQGHKTQSGIVRHQAFSEFLFMVMRFLWFASIDK